MTAARPSEDIIDSVRKALSLAGLYNCQVAHILNERELLEFTRPQGRQTMNKIMHGIVRGKAIELDQ